MKNFIKMMFLYYFFEFIKTDNINSINIKETNINLYNFYKELNSNLLNEYCNNSTILICNDFIGKFYKFNKEEMINEKSKEMNISKLNSNNIFNDLSDNYNIMIINRNVSNNIVNRVDYFIYDNNGEIIEMENKKIEIIKPMINDEYIKKYKYTEEKGYNISDKEIKLYNDRCEYYSNEDDKDVNMKDRRKYYLGIFCEDNCNIKNINYNELKIECECIYQSKSNLQNIINNFNQEIKINDEEIKFSNNFNNINFSLIKCITLLFCKYIFKNLCFYIFLIFFIILLIIFIIYLKDKTIPFLKYLNMIYNEYQKLKVSDNEVIPRFEYFRTDRTEEQFKNIQKENQININNINTENNIYKVENINSKKNVNKENLNSEEDEIVVNEINEINEEEKKVNNDVQSLNKKNIESSNLMTFNREIIKNIDNKDKKDKEIQNDKKNEEKKNKEEIKKQKESFLLEIKNIEQINELNYENAIIYDDRNFLKLFIDFFTVKEIILYTFIYKENFHLRIIKIYCFIFELSMLLFFNSIFYTDYFVHLIYLNDKISFKKRLPKCIYSSLLTYIIMFFLNFLTNSKKDYHKLIDNIENESNMSYIIEMSKINNNLKVKLKIFYIISVVLFIFFWFYSSSFCGVYRHNQFSLFINFLISFIINLVVSIFFCLIVVLIKYFSIKYKKELIYKIGLIII